MVRNLFDAALAAAQSSTVCFCVGKGHGSRFKNYLRSKTRADCAAHNNDEGENFPGPLVADPKANFVIDQPLNVLLSLRLQALSCSLNAHAITAPKTILNKSSNTAAGHASAPCISQFARNGILDVFSSRLRSPIYMPQPSIKARE